MATQNPFQQIGTYRLPESQIDRFFMGFYLGFPERSYEKKIIQQEEGREAIKKTGTPRRLGTIAELAPRGWRY